MNAVDGGQPRPRCQFEKALITRFADCAAARQRFVGEAIRYECGSPAGYRCCERYLERLRRSAGFVFGLRGAAKVLSNSQLIRLQCGGIDGLAALLPSGTMDAARIDIGRLLEVATALFADVDAIPLDRVMPFVSRYKARPPRGRRGDDSGHPPD